MQHMDLRSVLSELPLEERRSVIVAHVKKLLDGMLPTEELRFNQLMTMIWPKPGKKDPLRPHLIDIIVGAIRDGRLDGYWHKSPVGVPGTSVCAGKMIYPKIFHACRVKSFSNTRGPDGKPIQLKDTIDWRQRALDAEAKLKEKELDFLS